MIRAVLTVAAKDMRLYLRDRPALLLSFALPIVLATIFGTAIGSFSAQRPIARIELSVEDLDQSAASKKLVAALEKSEGLEVKSALEVRALVARGKTPAALLVPAGFGEDLAAARSPRLVLYRDPGKVVEQQVVVGNLMPALFRALGPEVGRAMMRKSLSGMGMPAAGIDQMERTMLPASDDAKDANSPSDFAGDMSKSLGLEVEDVTGTSDPSQKIASQAHALSGIAVMMLLFGLTACGGTILEEHLLGTLERLRLAPVDGSVILVGKMVFTVAAGVMQLMVLFAYGAIVFDLPVLRAPVALIVLSIAVALAATGVGLLLAVVCRTRKQLEGISTLVILAMSALGGSWFPLVIAPAWFRKLGHFTLNAWAMDGYQGIFWYGRDLGGIAIEVLVLLGIAAVTLFLAWRGWKRRYERTA